MVYVEKNYLMLVFGCTFKLEMTLKFKSSPYKFYIFNKFLNKMMTLKLF